MFIRLLMMRLMFIQVIFFNLGAKRMKVPVRAETCDHLSCFDGPTFFEQFATCLKTPKPLCPVCREKISFDSIRIDDYFVRALIK